MAPYRMTRTPGSDAYAKRAAEMIREGRKLGVRREKLRAIAKRHKQARDTLKVMRN